MRRYRYPRDYPESAPIDYATTLEALAIEQGVTRERIRQIELKALRKLREKWRGQQLRPLVEDMWARLLDQPEHPPAFGPNSRADGCIWHRRKPGSP